MNLRAILVLIATAIWFLIGGLTNWVCKKCQDPTATTQNIQQNVVPGGVSDANRGALVFSWSDENPLTNEAKFEAYKDSLLNGYNEGDSLLITGYYFDGENNSSSFNDLGMARAQKLKELFSQYIDPDKIVLKSERVATRNGVETNYFESSDFRILPKGLDLPAKGVVYFPYNSTNRLPDDIFDGYLNKLVDVLSNTDKTLTITGHTDTIGGERFNINLGMERAQAIRDAIIEEGIDADRIKILSKGYSEPASTNSTEEGRKLNRRVELKVE